MLGESESLDQAIPCISKTYISYMQVFNDESTDCVSVITDTVASKIPSFGALLFESQRSQGPFSWWPKDYFI